MQQVFFQETEFLNSVIDYNHVRKRGKEVKCRLIHIHAWDMGY